MKQLLSLTLLAVALLCPIYGDTKLATPAAPAAAVEKPKTPETYKLTETEQLRVKVLTQDLLIKQLQYQQAQTALQQLQTDFQKVQTDLQVVIDATYKQAGADKNKYDFSPQTMTFTKKTPTAAEPAKK